MPCISDPICIFSDPCQPGFDKTLTAEKLFLCPSTRLQRDIGRLEDSGGQRGNATNTTVTHLSETLSHQSFLKREGWYAEVKEPVYATKEAV